MKVFGEDFSKKLQKTPPFLKKGGTRKPFTTLKGGAFWKQDAPRDTFTFYQWVGLGLCSRLTAPAGP
ncbi:MULTISPECIES: hypothetical protein [Novacetimonas]|uniref:hypothetical protein n=1 Tax=Novacetimonas TaxID=2919364 RepID=UPI0011153CA6|nr:hypothetical protein [Novacetimonas hansenii]